MQKAKIFNDVATVSIKGNDYRIDFWYMNKDETINLFVFIRFVDNLLIKILT